MHARRMFRVFALLVATMAFGGSLHADNEDWVTLPPGIYFTDAIREGWTTYAELGPGMEYRAVRIVPFAWASYQGTHPVAYGLHYWYASFAFPRAGWCGRDLIVRYIHIGENPYDVYGLWYPMCRPMLPDGTFVTVAFAGDRWYNGVPWHEGE